MEVELCKELLKNPDVIKIRSKGLVFLYLDKETVIEFLFDHFGFSRRHTVPWEDRISVQCYRRADLIPEIRAKTIKGSGDINLLLVNSDSPEYAMTFELSINSKDRLISARMKDFPGCGEESITTAEKQGIQVNY